MHSQLCDNVFTLLVECEQCNAGSLSFAHASSCDSIALTSATRVCRASTLLARSNCCQHDHSFLLKDSEDPCKLAGGSDQSE